MRELDTNLMKSETVNYPRDIYNKFIIKKIYLLIVNT